jgi:hypothetical protein
MAEKQYVGKGKVVGTFGNIKIGLRVADLKANEKGYVNIIVQKMKEIDKYGNAYTVYVDDWVPNGGNAAPAPQQSFASVPAPSALPF